MAGATPTRTSVKAKEAVASCHGHVGRRDQPEPAGPVCPLTRASTGTGLSLNGREDLGHPVGGARAALGQSAPEQKTVPVPVSTTARTSASVVASRNACASCSRSRVERALRFEGESSVRVRMPSSWSHIDQGIRHGCAVYVRHSGAHRTFAGSVRSVIETDEHQLFRKTLRDLFEREIEPHVDEWEAARTFPAHELFPKLAAVGLLGLEYDEAVGGMGADHSYSLIAGEEMGRISCGGVPMAMAVQMSMATPALARYGSPELKETLSDAGHPGRGRDLYCRDRARRRQRRRRHPHPGRPRRRRMGHQRLQALHHERHPGRLALPPRPHLRRSRVPRHVAHCGADGASTASPCRASSRSWACGRATRQSCPSPTSAYR